MTDYNKNELNCHFTPRATLIGLGVRVEQMGIIETISEQVSIKQKTVKDSPVEKLTDTLITILSGGQGLAEANKRVGTDRLYNAPLAGSDVPNNRSSVKR